MSSTLSSFSSSSSSSSSSAAAKKRSHNDDIRSALPAVSSPQPQQQSRKKSRKSSLSNSNKSNKNISTGRWTRDIADTDATHPTSSAAPAAAPSLQENPEKKTKRKITKHTVSFKYALCKEYEQSQIKGIQKFINYKGLEGKVHNTNLLRWYKSYRKGELVENGTEPKKGKKVTYHKTEQAFLEYLNTYIDTKKSSTTESEAQQQLPSIKIMLKVALEKNREFHPQESGFQASNGWLDKFLRRHNFRNNFRNKEQKTNHITQKGELVENGTEPKKGKKLTYPKTEQAEQKTNHITLLDAWYEENVNYPFLDEDITKMLSEKTGKTSKYIHRWMEKKRRKMGNTVQYKGRGRPCKKENAPLDAWYHAHLHNPYPNVETIASLANKTGKTQFQVKLWLKTKRYRTIIKIQKEYVFYLFGIKTTLTKEKLQDIQSNGFSLDKNLVRMIMKMLGKKKEALKDERLVQLYDKLFDWNLQGNSTLDDEQMKQMKEQINKKWKEFPLNEKGNYVANYNDINHYLRYSFCGKHYQLTKLPKHLHDEVMYKCFLLHHWLWKINVQYNNTAEFNALAEKLGIYKSGKQRKQQHPVLKDDNEEHTLNDDDDESPVLKDDNEEHTLNDDDDESPVLKDDNEEHTLNDDDVESLSECYFEETDTEDMNWEAIHSAYFALLNETDNEYTDEEDVLVFEA